MVARLLKRRKTQRDCRHASWVPCKHEWTFHVLTANRQWAMRIRAQTSDCQKPYEDTSIYKLSVACNDATFIKKQRRYMSSSEQVRTAAHEEKHEPSHLSYAASASTPVPHQNPKQKLVHGWRKTWQASDGFWQRGWWRP
jgi:ubiquinone biosynthesis protein Coq4